MPRQVTKGAVRHTHMSLKRALSEWKAAGRKDQSAENSDNAMVREEAWTRLSEEVNDAASMLRNAEAQGFNINEVAATFARAKEILKGRPEKSSEPVAGPSRISPPQEKGKGGETTDGGNES